MLMNKNNFWKKMFFSPFSSGLIDRCVKLIFVVLAVYQVQFGFCCEYINRNFTERHLINHVRCRPSITSPTRGTPSTHPVALYHLQITITLFVILKRVREFLEQFFSERWQEPFEPYKHPSGCDLSLKPTECQDVARMCITCTLLQTIA